MKKDIVEKPTASLPAQSEADAPDLARVQDERASVSF